METVVVSCTHVLSTMVEETSKMQIKPKGDFCLVTEGENSCIVT